MTGAVALTAMCAISYWTAVRATNGAGVGLGLLAAVVWLGVLALISPTGALMLALASLPWFAVLAVMPSGE